MAEVLNEYLHQYQSCPVYDVQKTLQEIQGHVLYWMLKVKTQIFPGRGKKEIYIRYIFI